jgi:hypothetical protein
VLDEVEGITETPDGLRVLIRRSKTDQEAQGQEIAIPRGYRLRPVEAMQTWLAAASITPWGRATASAAPLSAFSAAEIERRRAPGEVKP